MADQLFVIYPTGIFGNVDSFTLESCDIRTVDCSPDQPDSFFTECSRRWNPNKCVNESCYFTPWVRGEKFMIQTTFVDLISPDAENPTAAFDQVVRISIIDAVTGSTAGTGSAAVSDRFFNGWNGSNSFQVIEIDTSKPLFSGLSCWYIQVESIDSIGTALKTICSHDYKEYFETCDGLEIVTVEGRYGGFDCSGLYYLEPDEFVGTSFAYENKMNIAARIVDGNDSFTKTLFSRSVVKTELTAVSNLVLMAAIPPGIKNFFVRNILSAPGLYVDGRPFEVDSFSLSNKLNSNQRMFLFNVAMTNTCENEFGCTPFIPPSGEPPIVVVPPGPNACCIDCILP